MKTGGLVAVAGAAAALALLIVIPTASFAGPAADSDTDGVFNVLDNCRGMANAGAAFCDTDQDGYGNRCDCDLNNDGVCNLTDFNLFKAGFPGAGANIRDFNCDGVTDLTDFNIFKSEFGFPGPSAAGTMQSGLSCAGTVPCSL